MFVSLEEQKGSEVGIKSVEKIVKLGRHNGEIPGGQGAKIILACLKTTVLTLRLIIDDLKKA